MCGHLKLPINMSLVYHKCGLFLVHLVMILILLKLVGRYVCIYIFFFTNKNFRIHDNWNQNIISPMAYVIIIIIDGKRGFWDLNVTCTEIEDRVNHFL